MRQGKLFEGNILILEAFQAAELDSGEKVCEACLFELIVEAIKNPTMVKPASYDGAAVRLNTAHQGPNNKYCIYVEDPQTNDVRKIEFGDTSTDLKKSSPRHFKTTHRCSNDSSSPRSHWSPLK